MIVPGESLITGPCPLRLQLLSIPPEYVRIGAGVGDFVTEAGGVDGAASNELPAISRITVSVFMIVTRLLYADLAHVKPQICEETEDGSGLR
jgi:hypothetical protein